MTEINTNLTERLRAGRQLARAGHVALEIEKRGNLRAGNSGMMSPEGEVAGNCHRLAHLRALGLETEEPNDSKLIMFQMGTANETVVYEDLMHTKAEDEIILRESEIPIQWCTSNGTKVTGRPDMVVCRKVPVAELEPDVFLYPTEREGLVTPVFGIEIKSIASVWTTREVLFDGQPKLEHLIQAAHYAWKVGCPFRLMYKQYTNQTIPSWAQKMFPRRGEAHSEHIEYNEKGDVKNINPFEIVYELQVNAKGLLQYRREDVPGSKWKTTLVRTADIERFYEFTSRIAETGDLGPRPLSIDPHGKEKNYSKCGYCPLNEICDQAETGKWKYPKWLSAVTKVSRKVTESSSEGGTKK